MEYDFWGSVLKVIRSTEFYVPVITICITFLLINASKRVIGKLIKKGSNDIIVKRRNTIVVLADNIIKYLLIIFAALIILNAWGFNVTGIITGLGVAGVVAGLALQDALKDIIMGCNIIMDSYYVVGDLVDFNGFTGEVIEFGLKNTKIRAFNGEVLIVANREISQIKNISLKSANILLEIPVSYEDTEENVSKVLVDVCKTISEWKEVKGTAEYLGINNFKDSSVDYLIKIPATSESQYAVRRKALTLIKNTFDKKGIKIPYTQIEVHNGKDI